MGAMASKFTSLTIVFLNRLFGRRSKKTSKLRVTCLCVGDSPVTGGFPAQMASNAENVSIWWSHHVALWTCLIDSHCAQSTIYAFMVTVGLCSELLVWWQKHSGHIKKRVRGIALKAWLSSSMIIVVYHTMLLSKQMFIFIRNFAQTEKWVRGNSMCWM